VVPVNTGTEQCAARGAWSANQEKLPEKPPQEITLAVLAELTR
jgi:hypothetical protein